MAVTNVSTLYTLSAGDLIFQGPDTETKSFYAYVDSYIKLYTASPKNTAKDIYKIRMYNFVNQVGTKK